MWKGLNKILGRERTSVPVAVTHPETNAKVEDPEVVGELFNKYFTSCFKQNSNASDQLVSQFVEKESKSSLALIPPDKTEVFREIQQLKNNSAVGHDEISTEVIKKLSDKLTPLLLLLISAIFTSGIYPIIFKKAVIIPIHKGR
jgi:hypothetical protein